MDRFTFVLVKTAFALVPLFVSYWISGWDANLMLVLVFFCWGNNIGNLKYEDVLEAR